MNNNRILHRVPITLLFLTLLALTPSLSPTEVITYYYDNAGQVKKVVYGDGTTVADTTTLSTEFNK